MISTRKKYYQIVRLIFVSFFLVSLLSACALANRVQNGLSALRATPTPPPHTLGVSASGIVHVFQNNGFTIIRDANIGGQTEIRMQKKDTNYLVDLVTVQDQVIHAVLWIPFTNTNFSKDPNYQYFIKFLESLLSNWKDLQPWMDQSVNQMESKFKNGDFVYTNTASTENAFLELTVSEYTKMVVLSITAYQ